LIHSFLGSNKDYVVIGSDSGKISIVEFDATTNDWKVVHCEVFGKSGCRRIVPGQYLAADPKGRAIMIGKLLILSVSSLVHCLMHEVICYFILQFVLYEHSWC
jgi:hypothetical protein